MKPIVFPEVPVPDVSIIVAVYGAEEWLLRCLEAIRERTEPGYEVILVDNASPDGLAARLPELVSNARLISNPVNRGFGPACNQGANAARGEMLVFLNSDAIVHEGWLSALRRALDEDPGAAAAAPQLQNLDGTVQEAGALLFSNGVTDFYGMGDDPNRAAYRFRRPLDYASAACLAIRKRAFFDVGGFDAMYAPAYYEDVDLCLWLSERGWRILYEPGAIVTHARGASSSRALAERLWRRNNPLFVARWKERLKSRPEYRPLEHATIRLHIAARDAPARARILLVVADDAGAAEAAESAIERLFADCVRTVVCATGILEEAEIARLAARGWEAAESAAIGNRRFHYDAVVFSEAGARDPLEELLAATQPQAARVVFEAPEELERALTGAGIPPAASNRVSAMGR